MTHAEENENADYSRNSIMHQGKSVEQWKKLLSKFNFTEDQIIAMIRGGADLEKMLYFGLDESARQPEDVETVEDLIAVLERNSSPDDKVMFRVMKTPGLLFDIKSKNGTCIIDIVPGNSKLNEDDTDMNEGYNWRNGGYGGTGRSYRQLADRGEVPRGKELGWYAVEELDPKAAGKMAGWRCGPSNFKFKDLLYPERNYKVGTMVMRNKHIQAGTESGVKYIAIPSYFAAIKDNDQEAIHLLNMLGIPLNLTFGMDPNDDYSVTYTVK